MQTISVVDAAAGRRANAYYALARLLEPPTVWEESLPGIVRAAFGDLPEPLGRLGGRLAARIEEAWVERESLEVAHAKLMLGPFEIRAAPWASFYLEDEPRLMGPTSQYAAAAYAEAGLGPAEKLKDAPDHVTHELEFMYFLSFNSATIEDPVWTERQARFWGEHLGCWLPRFADAVVAAEAHPFYDTVGKALHAFSAFESQTLDTASDAEGELPNDR